MSKSYHIILYIIIPPPNSVIPPLKSMVPPIDFAMPLPVVAREIFKGVHQYFIKLWRVQNAK